MRTIKSFTLWSVTLALLTVIAACAPAAPAPTPTAAKEAPKTEAPKTAPAAPTATQPAQAPAPTATQPAKPAAPTPAPAAKKPEVSQIKVGLMPIENLSTVYAADKLGFFKEEGLTVESVTLGGGAEILPAVQAGRIHFGYSNVASIIQAREQGADFTIVSGVVAVPNAPPDVDRIMIKADSTIKGPQDLVGKRIGTNNLRNMSWMIERAWLKKYGVDPEKVTYREVPFPQMADAIINNQIDAGYMIEPFAAAALEQGKLKVLAHPYNEFQPGMDLAVFAASEKWVKENPVATAGFVRAFGRSVDVLTKDLAQRKKFTIEYTKSDPAVVDKIMLAPLRTKIDAAKLQKTADLMVEQTLLKEKMDVSKVIWETAR